MRDYLQRNICLCKWARIWQKTSLDGGNSKSSPSSKKYQRCVCTAHFKRRNWIDNFNNAIIWMLISFYTINIEFCSRLHNVCDPSKEIISCTFGIWRHCLFKSSKRWNLTKQNTKILWLNRCVGCRVVTITMLTRICLFIRMNRNPSLD